MEEVRKCKTCLLVYDIDSFRINKTHFKNTGKIYRKWDCCLCEGKKDKERKIRNRKINKNYAGRKKI